MTGLEIGLLIAGVLCIVLSYIISEKVSSKNAAKSVDELFAQNEDIIKKAVADKIEEMIKETLDDTEERLKKISNEKIMALGDYSKMVNEEIEKNHNEVVFIYSMLDDKEKEVKAMLTEINTAKSKLKTAGIDQKKIVPLKAEETVALSKTADNKATTLDLDELVKSDSSSIGEKAVVLEGSGTKDQVSNLVKAVKKKEVKLNFESGDKKSSNKQILELYSKGRTNVEIAKELGLGLGEVKLVLDLFKGAVN